MDTLSLCLGNIIQVYRQGCVYDDDDDDRIL